MIAWICIATLTVLIWSRVFISVVVDWKFFVGKFLNWHCLVKFGIMELPFCRFYALWRGQFLKSK
jgi:hypothetical protein